MRDHLLGNLVLGVEDDFLSEYPDMLVRAAAGATSYDARERVLTVEGDADFTTYLNALSLGKWRRYAGVGSAFLHLETCGAGFEVYATWLTEGAEVACRSDRPVARAEASDAWTSTDVALPAPEGAHIVSFALRTSGAVRLRAGHWYARVNDEDVRDVRLAIATTTFRKEQYVLRNIEAIRGELFSQEGGYAGRIRLIVVDNGRTLDAEALSDDDVSVIPNPNVGGAGGFARGMMEALDVDATHVLLMDDDVRVLPESFVRVHSLLCIARGRYADAFVEGAMLNMEDPNLLFEDVATIKRDGMYGRIKQDLLVNTVSGMSANEATDVELPRAYGAWWFCCIPTSVVREKGLPLPLFVRCDDVEYGMRCKPTMMTMSGVCVWHERFEGRFRASVDSYQLTRNFLAMAAVDELDPRIVQAFMMRFSRTFHIYLRSMSYETCGLMLDGLEDYLKGPTFIAEESGERIFMEKGSRNERLYDVSELDPELVAATVPDPRYLGAGRDRGMVLKTLEMIPHDRHVLPDFLLIDKPAPAYYSRGAYPARRTMFRKTLVAYDQSATKAHVRTVDRERWRALRKRYAGLMRDYRKRKAQVAQEWRDALPWLSSREFWEDYLARN